MVYREVGLDIIEVQILLVMELCVGGLLLRCFGGVLKLRKRFYWILCIFIFSVSHLNILFFYIIYVDHRDFCYFFYKTMCDQLFKLHLWLSLCCCCYSVTEFVLF
ncbi:hypothetical protein RND81_10G033000 [Saponaria officinalis]|uniref:Uncharacterized protein n=1 Tax=Saponaria officinalis TaxID=3572 RepID=A0AAW1HZX2_SAPOF